MWRYLEKISVVKEKIVIVVWGKEYHASLTYQNALRVFLLYQAKEVVYIKYCAWIFLTVVDKASYWNLMYKLQSYGIL